MSMNESEADDGDDELGNGRDEGNLSALRATDLLFEAREIVIGGGDPLGKC